MKRLKRLSSLATASVLSVSALLNIALMPLAHAAVDICTWTAAVDNTFSNGGNWSGCDNAGVPENGDSLVIDIAAGAATVNNDMVGMSFNNVTFSGTSATGKTIIGNAFTITGNVTNSSNQTGIINNNVTFTGSTTLDAASAPATLTFNGTTSGSGSLTKVGSGSVFFEGAFNLTGSVTVNVGSLRIVAFAADASFSSLTVANGADFTYDPFTSSGAGTTYTFTKPITSGGVLHFESMAGGLTAVLNLTGTITLTADTTIVSGDNLTVYVKGPLHGPGFTLKSAGTATVINQSTDNTSSTPGGTVGAAQVGVGAPDTGFAAVTSNPALLFGGISIAALGIALAGRRLQLASSKSRR